MNQIKNIINMLGIRQKEVADSIGISAQALNMIYKSKKPRKHNIQIATYLGINPMYLTKDELTEEDKNEITKQFYKLTHTTARPDTTIYNEDIILDEEGVISFIKDNSYEDYYKMKIETRAIDMKFPQIIFKWANIEVNNDGEIILKSEENYRELHLYSRLINRAIIRFINENSKIYILELNNGMTLNIMIINRFLEENDYFD